VTAVAEDVDVQPPDPSDTEVTDTVKLWADAAGVAHDQIDERVARPGWRLSFLAETPCVYRNNDAGEASPSVHPDVDPLLIWALAVISGRTVDVGCLPCIGCHGKGEYTERYSATGSDADRVRALEQEGWTIDERYGDYVSAEIVRPCLHCGGTGKSDRRDIREAARLVLDAWRQPVAVSRAEVEAWEKANHPLKWWHYRQAREAEGWQLTYHGGADPIFRGTRGGDPTSIASLLVSMEKWDVRDPLGPAVSNWLREVDLGERINGWRRGALASVRAAWERLTVPCVPCKGTGRALTQAGPSGDSPSAIQFVHRGQRIVARPGHRVPEPPRHLQHLFTRGQDGWWMMGDRRQVEAPFVGDGHCQRCDGHGRVKPRPTSASDGEESEYQRWRRVAEEAREAALDPAVRSATNQLARAVHQRGPSRRLGFSFRPDQTDPNEWLAAISERVQAELAPAYHDDQRIERITVEVEPRVFHGLRSTWYGGHLDHNLQEALTAWFAGLGCEVGFAQVRTQPQPSDGLARR
jgi:hypothetical protein